MRVLVHFSFMTWMVMLMGTMLARVLVVMHMGICGVGMLVGMFMHVVMYMGVGMLVGVDLIPMGVFMAVHVGVLMGM
jgi:hypothetical protein